MEPVLVFMILWILEPVPLELAFVLKLSERYVKISLKTSILSSSSDVAKSNASPACLKKQGPHS